MHMKVDVLACCFGLHFVLFFYNPSALFCVFSFAMPILLFSSQYNRTPKTRRSRQYTTIQ